MLILLLAKKPIENESEGGERESWGVGGRPKTMPLHFPFLMLLSYFIYFISFHFFPLTFV